MIKKLIYFLLVLFIVVDLVFSFAQHYHTPFDGDMAGGIIPAEDVKPILNDPLGIKVFSEDQTYPNPNRFFSHWSFYTFFREVPKGTRHFTSPLNSVYLASALAKTLIQASLLFLLAAFASGTTNILRLNFVIAAAIITPLFQLNGYRAAMGIIDPATTYAFFYALPTVGLLIFMYPLLMQKLHHYPVGWWKYLKFIWPGFALVIFLSGPLNPGIMLVAIATMVIISVIKRRTFSIGRSLLFTLIIPGILLSAYSLYLGSYNSIAPEEHPSLLDLYGRLPGGILKQFTQKIGIPLLLIGITINAMLIQKKYHAEGGAKALKVLKVIGLFSLLYIVLLPLGGYREYRPDIVRYDTMIPVTLCIIFYFAYSSLFIIQKIPKQHLKWFAPYIVLVAIIFTIADKPGFDKNDCEREAIQYIATSRDHTVKINGECNVLSWEKITEPQNSKLNGKLLKLWKITKTEKLYYHE